MNSTLAYRVASVLLVLFALGHTIGFRQPAESGEGASVGTVMKSAHVTVQGSRRTFWDFYVGFGLFVTVFLLLSAVLAWQLGGLSREALAQVPSAATWGLAVAFTAITFMTWRYFFLAPGVLSTLVTICLFAAAWFAGHR